MANISKLRREDLLEKISQIRKFIENSKADKNTHNLLQYLNEIAKDVKGKKYGLVFEEHREAIDEILEKNLPVLTEDESLEINNGGEQNFLIEGDNLASLKLLEKTHRGKIDVIYIDPPYNTGNKVNQDFFYDDHFVDENDTFRHSKWCSFMEKRLEIARKLLSEKGVIFISIDDHEQATLKMLCDRIFGEKNSVAEFIWEKTQHFGRQAKNYYSNCEYVLCYSKNLYSNEKLNELLVEKFNDDLQDAPLYNASNPEKTLTFPSGSVKFNIADGKYEASSDEKYIMCNAVNVVNGLNENELILKFRSRWSAKTVIEEYEKGCRFWVKSKNFAIRAIYQEDKISITSPKQIIFTNLNNPFCASNRIGDKVGTTETGTDDLEKIIGPSSFKYPKPTSLISYLLGMIYEEEIGKFSTSSTILDFFAGSGTTGHAVLKLNESDGGHRKFILCTNNQNNICRDITYQRLKTVITGKRKDGSVYGDSHPASLKYFRIDYVPISEKLYYEYADELLKHVRELVELENGIDFSKNKEIAIILTDEEMERFVESNKSKKSLGITKVYYGHNVLLSNHQMNFMKKHNIKLNVIPDYYYQELEK